jgi:hypothetical protein
MENNMGSFRVVSAPAVPETARIEASNGSTVLRDCWAMRACTLDGLFDGTFDACFYPSGYQCLSSRPLYVCRTMLALWEYPPRVHEKELHCVAQLKHSDPFF